MFEIFTTDKFDNQLDDLKKDKGQTKRYKAIKKTLKLLQNPRHQSLQTHEFTSLFGPKGEKIYEAYAEQNTPAAYKVFWYYGPGRKQITVIAFTAHP